MENSLSISSALSFGWNRFKERPWMMVGALLVIFIISAIVTSIVETINANGPAAAVLVASVADFVVQTFVGMGLIAIMLRAHDAIETVELKHLWNPSPFLYYIIATILTGLATLIGFLLLIVPGFIAAVMLLFTPYLVIDKKMGPISAMKESMRMTKGHRWMLFGLLLALMAINIVGALLLLVGLLVSIPVSMLALIHVYRTLSREDAHVVEHAPEHHEEEMQHA